MNIIYLIGAPGSGKTTLTEAFTRDWIELGKFEKPIKYRTHATPYGDSISLGWLRPTFGGTDTLGNTAILEIEKWLPGVQERVIYGEGDRLANKRFFDLARSIGKLHLFYLDTDPVVAEERRHQRSQLTGKVQNPSWVAGRVTKHRNLANAEKAIRIPGNLTPEEGADVMRQHLSSALG